MYQTLVLLAGFGMMTNQGDKLPANLTSTRRLPRTLSDMGHNFLHPKTGQGLAIEISTLASMNQALDTPLDSIEVIGIAILVCGSLSFPYLQQFLTEFTFLSFDQDISSQNKPSSRNFQTFGQFGSIKSLKNLFTNMWKSKIDDFI